VGLFEGLAGFLCFCMFTDIICVFILLETGLTAMATSSTSTVKRKLWIEESMEAPVSSVLNDNKGLREAARFYNIPVKTLRRRVNGSVKVGCKPGPSTVLTNEEEDKLAAT